MNDPNADMHKRSGAVHDRDPLVDLFYTLLRDGHVAPGALETLVREAAILDNANRVYSNGWLAKYAQDLVTRLDIARNKPPESNTPVLK